MMDYDDNSDKECEEEEEEDDDDDEEKENGQDYHLDDMLDQDLNWELEVRIYLLVWCWSQGSP